ncbi:MULTISPECIES: succinylglutamate desuccinylase/aspartoacylase family protein [unclassified Paracoccus (in: a-proteobacteria)]|uniref:succinylglutamate desuccinylase/aspartoacylase family protein n=1 Tax=unclassified Paracoccus (in: a-proteobacteria) TaxID=2688777 RepID=UPI0012B3AC7F|nr:MULTISPECIES: succinylglutamate desuccinylase/aspartoacylase family protein [unclassified Paracoccus (in: a-proteobacteria)]UXU76438.1 M14 family metallopeptidase [Paracoccus sp. SMMA_5]UXU82224.1 M14 family metallopeptidase [Paracoccus sp. SMMA_5_TC]
MRERNFSFDGRGAGSRHQVTTLAFGQPGARPHVHVQGGLHADEGPGMMVARLLADRLAEAEAAGQIRGAVTVVPFANPLGLGQVLHGDHSGRFDLYDGRNFNRDYPDLTEAAAENLQGRLGQDAAANAALVRQALRQALSGLRPVGPADVLRHHLMGQALDADVVLDLHCDGEAALHLYTQPQAWPAMQPLAALTGCVAVLLAEVSGGNPFDEALSHPWAALAARFPDHPIPYGCASCTLELRGRADVSRRLGAQDADAIFRYLQHLGVIAGTTEVPEATCQPTPLSGSEALIAPVAGLLSYCVDPGTWVGTGQVVAEITDLESGAVCAVTASTSGVFYARPATRIAEVGKRLGKIAGTVPFRDGPLLSP